MRPPDSPPARRPQASSYELAAIFLGGFAGSIARTALAHGFPVSGAQWPWPTFTVNMLGAALLGYLVARTAGSARRSLYGRAFMGIGLCGALTTFSTLILELLGMIESSRWSLAAGYAAASVAGGLAIVLLSSRWGRRGRAPG